MRHLLLLAIISHIFSCSSPSETKKGKAIKNDYAKGFVINQLSNGEKKLLIYHPQTGKKIDDIIIDKNKPTIVIPLSATHLSFIDALGELSTVKGVTFGESIFNPIIKEKLKSNEIVNLGQDAAPNK